MAEAWPEQRRLAARLATTLGSMDSRARRRFAAMAAEHALSPFALHGDDESWVRPLVRAIGSARDFADGRTSEAELLAARDVAFATEEAIWDHEKRADEGELHTQALGHAARAVVAAVSLDEGAIEARLWGYEERGDEDDDRPDDFAVTASRCAVESASTLAWFRAVAATGFTVSYLDVGEATVVGELAELSWQVSWLSDW